MRTQIPRDGVYRLIFLFNSDGEGRLHVLVIPSEARNPLFAGGVTTAGKKLGPNSITMPEKLGDSSVPLLVFRDPRFDDLLYQGVGQMLVVRELNRPLGRPVAF